MIKRLLNPLTLDMQFFSTDETGGATSSDATLNTEVQEQHQAGETSTKQTEHMIPKSRFDEVNQKFKDVQAQLNELLTAKQEADRKSQEEQGEFKKLYETTSQEFIQVKEQYQTVEERAKQLEGVINGLLESKLGNIPEEFHDLIPDNLTPEAKLDWINKAEVKGLFGKKEQKSIGETSNPGQAQSTDLNALSPIQLMKAGYGSK